MPDDPTSGQPVITPYAGTSGWSGSETSEQRAKTQDSDGTTSMRQRTVLRAIRGFGVTGITVKELRAYTTLHHGQASSTLTVLHKAGLIVRLRETRDKCKVYVVPEHVHGRETEDPGRTRGSKAAVQEERERILTELAADDGRWISKTVVEQIVRGEV
jgi:hypothetical protein